jgi:lipopolysaccharide/colanic/teichoic acid biosynthesis glycosyltransferase
VQLDVRYARRRCFLLDMAIILRTVGVILFPRDRGAY